MQGLAIVAKKLDKIGLVVYGCQNIGIRANDDYETKRYNQNSSRAPEFLVHLRSPVQQISL